MKKISVRWKIKFYLVTIGIPLFAVLTILFWPPQFDESYLGELPYKLEQLKESGAGRLIIIGGSSTAFGIRSDLIEQELGMKVVNVGLYAPLGSRIMLEACMDDVRENDIVVFSPEQNQETLSFSFQPKELWQAMDGNYSLLKTLDEDALKQMLGAFPEFALSKLKYMVNGKPELSGIYRRSSFNEYGDIAAAGREENIMPELYDPTMMIDFTEYPKDEFIEYLNRYEERVKEKGAAFYYRFCPMNELAVTDEEDLDAYAAWLREEAQFSILGDPHECVLESGWFYDTNFHLNASGAVVNTYYFVRDLKAELKDASRTEIEVPKMPAAAEETTDDQLQDNRDAEKFLYEEKDGNLSIVGVTENGSKKSELSVPSRYQGKKVTEVQKGSFRNCTKLESISIYSGIALQDESFSGCDSLKKIILHGEPSEIIAGSHLLDGTEALLYVQDTDAYCLDYTWGIYSDRIRNLDMNDSLSYR